MITLTVGLPVYNAMPFLPEVIDSLLRQTWSDFELLVIDDGSTDGSSDFLGAIKDTRLRLISQPNQGLPTTLNRMLREANGAWLVRQDADDVAYPERLSLMVDAIQQWPDAGMFYTLADYVRSGPGRISWRSTVADPRTLRAITRAGYLLSICHPTVVLNIAKTLDLGGYRSELRSAQDSELWWRMALRYDIQLIPKSTLAVRLTASGISSSSLQNQNVGHLFGQYLLLSELWKLPALPYDLVRRQLMDLINLRLLRYRSHLRQSAIAFDRFRIGSSLYHALASMLIAPDYLLERILYELPRNRKLAVNGVSPLLFAANLDKFWQT
jgi:glycosyltransferase involved in cell wall biosynthesis